MSDQKTILVTGGKGTVAFAINELVRGDERGDDEEWHFIDLEEADLRDVNATRRIFEKIKPSHVIHCAAMVGGIYYQIGQQLDLFVSNNAIDTNVLNMSIECGVKRVVSFSSLACMPWDPNIAVMDESMVHTCDPHESMYGYGMSKRNSLAFIRLCNEQHGLGYTSVIPTNIFGPNDNYHLEGGHVVSNLIRKVHEAKIDGKPLILRGNGQTKRQLIYSRDVARIVVWMIREYQGIEPLILSDDSHSEIVIEDLAKLICKVMDFHGPIEFDTTHIDGAPRRTVTNARLMKHLPDFKFTPMEKALKEVSDWFVSNYDIARK